MVIKIKLPRIPKYKINSRGLTGFLKKIIFLSLITLGVLTLLSMVFWYFERTVNPEMNPLTAIFLNVIFLISGAEFFPQTAGGKMILILSIFTGIIFLSSVISSILSFELKGGKIMERIFEEHIVICGWDERVRTIIKELDSPHIKHRRPLVVIAPIERPKELDKDVGFVSGDPTVDNDLKKANIEKAWGAIILSDRKGSEPDAKSILTGLAIGYLNKHVYTVVELCDSKNIHHLKHAEVDEIICSQDIGVYLMVESMFTHKLSKLIGELLTFQVGNEIYKIPAPKDCINASVTKALFKLKKEKNVILIAVEKNGKIITNPEGDYKIEEGNHLFVIAEKEPAW